jgi:coenzyme F420-0:L-glutamate ligase / coenzyme F420-1:gamma-L-glutamate ligase
MQNKNGMRLEIFGLSGFPDVKPNDDVARLIAEAVERNSIKLTTGDVVAVAQKIISKAEGRLVVLRDIIPSALAREWAREIGSDPRLVEVVLRESTRIVRMSSHALITETRHGLVCANAGVDQSNISGTGWVACLPKNPDRSARQLVRKLRDLSNVSVAVIITDSFGRPWRLGQTNVAIGAAGLQPLRDLRGTQDAFGHTLRATMLAVADELAAASGLAMGKSRRVPVVIIRGYRFRAGKIGARKLIRPVAEDLFR